MQPFDALTIQAVLDEAKPLLLNRRVDRVFQLGRDEVLISLRSKAGMVFLLLSAHATYGRICLMKGAPSETKNERAPQNNSNFAVLLRKTLTSATLVHIEQLPGERIVDFVFSCTDEVGTASHKVLTAEVMGRHSNLIFWDKAREKIVTASHLVTKEMSRQREVAPNLTYVRPPGQERTNIFKVEETDFNTKWSELANVKPNESAESSTQPAASTIEQWLVQTYTGLGRNLSEEIIASSGVKSVIKDAVADADSAKKLWTTVANLRHPAAFKPAMRNDLSRYTVLSLMPEVQGSGGETSGSGEWKHFHAVNDMVDEYYAAVEAREQFQQLRERLKNELRSELDKLTSRLGTASQHVKSDDHLSEMKRSGDLVLAHLSSIEPGQTDLEIENLFSESGEKLTIKLNPNLTPSQNAQWFYRQFSKSRNRQSAAKLAFDEAEKKQEVVDQQQKQLEAAKTIDELKALRELIIGRKPNTNIQQKPQVVDKKKSKQKMLSVTSSDGWTIYVGRNRHENDQLLSKLAQPNDIWLHNLGQGGAHVLIRVPASKQEPPLSTLKEAAHVAARLSKASSGSKVRVVYTQCKFVKKLGKDKPGQVRYENEKTLEIDTSEPMPKCMRQLFSH
ncbi:MAG: NFACT family protein [Leptolyngbya sp.]|nr:NFACT family protein [Candidatus Melainabacteria bacterium]